MKAILLVLSLFVANLAFAGVELKQSGKSLGTVISLDCGSSITCTKDNMSKGYIKLNAAQPPIAATATTITADQCGSTFINSGAVLMNLPKVGTGTVGCQLTFVVGNASNFDINPDNADTILTLTNAAGDSIRNATVGGTVTLQAVGTASWVVLGVNGTWTDIN